MKEKKEKDTVNLGPMFPFEYNQCKVCGMYYRADTVDKCPRIPKEHD